MNTEKNKNLGANPLPKKEPSPPLPPEHEPEPLPQDDPPITLPPENEPEPIQTPLQM